MASFVILKMAEEKENESQKAATILKCDRYVDDLIHSCADKSEGERSMKEVDNVLATGSFKVKE